MTAQRVVRGNCVLWALARYSWLRREWRAAGRPIGQEPALRIRNSRLEPREIARVKVPHFEVEHFSGGRWVREGWAPLDKRPLPWWHLWRALWGDGEIVREVLR